LITIMVVALMLSKVYGLCSCDDCSCDDGACPIYVTPGTYKILAFPCGDYCSGSYSIASTDEESVFTTMGLTLDNYLAFEDDDEYFIVTDLSGEDVICFEGGEEVETGMLFIVIDCITGMDDGACPITYETDFYQNFESVGSAESISTGTWSGSQTVDYFYEDGDSIYCAGESESCDFSCKFSGSSSVSCQRPQCDISGTDYIIPEESYSGIYSYYPESEELLIAFEGGGGICVYASISGKTMQFAYDESTDACPSSYEPYCLIEFDFITSYIVTGSLTLSSAFIVHPGYFLLMIFTTMLML